MRKAQEMETGNRQKGDDRMRSKTSEIITEKMGRKWKGDIQISTKAWATEMGNEEPEMSYEEKEKCRKDLGNTYIREMDRNQKDGD